MWFTQIPIKRNDFKEQKYNIYPPGQGVRLQLWFVGQVTIKIKLIHACLLLVWPEGDMQLSSSLKSKSLEIWNYSAATFMKINCQGTAYIQQ
jgi:hypothetical protein